MSETTQYQVLQVMDLKKGHEELKYDPSDPADVRRIMDFITEKLNNGFYLYGYTKDGEYKAIKKINDIDKSELREFVLTKSMKKKLVTLPTTGG
ncbi:MAG: hypothetical protein ACRD9Q_10285 [Nitrososphaeraceae archaeon]